MSDTKPVIYERKEAERLTDLLVEYNPDDAGWRVLSRHLAQAYVANEATHLYRAGHEAKPKSKFDRAESWKVLDAIADIMAEWPDCPLRYHTVPTADTIRWKLNELATGKTSRQMEIDAAAAYEAERAEQAHKIDAAMRELYAPKAAE